MTIQIKNFTIRIGAIAKEIGTLIFMVLFSYPSITGKFFSLSVKLNPENTYIKMHVFSPTLNTVLIPQTSAILSKLLPSIHASQCFNEKGLPFSREVMHTEIGHLFEHILLEYMYQCKVTHGNSRAVINGETSWNWEKDPHGLFHILINVGFDEISTFPPALPKAIRLLELILFHDPYYRQNKPFSPPVKQTPSIRLAHMGYRY